MCEVSRDSLATIHSQLSPSLPLSLSPSLPLFLALAEAEEIPAFRSSHLGELASRLHEMGSGAGGQAAAPPQPPRPSIVCCMCGDRGLLGELFRCKVCLFRAQHKYCSDLYPKADTYKACNWCLREDKGKALAGEAAAMGGESSSPSADAAGGTFGWKLQRGASPQQLSKPVKKQRTPERAAATPGEKRKEELSPGMPGRVRQAFRGKVRRYKLLEEVSS